MKLTPIVTLVQSTRLSVAATGMSGFIQTTSCAPPSGSLKVKISSDPMAKTVFSEIELYLSLKLARKTRSASCEVI